MGRKKLPPVEKNSHAKSQAEQWDKLKREFGEEEFNNAEAERKRTSRQRVWETIHQDEKDRQIALARIRGQRFRAKKAEKEALQPGPQPAPQRAQPGPQPGPQPAPQRAQPAPHPAPQRGQPGPEMATPRRRRTNWLHVIYKEIPQRLIIILRLK